MSETNPSHRIVAGMATDTGRVREHNEDNLLADPEHGLFVVADGMGGQQAGALASKIVVSVLPSMIEARLKKLIRPRTRSIRYWLRQEILNLSQRLQQESNTKIGFKGMGATIVAALIRGDRAHIAHMGDSRAYLLRHGQLNQLTQDHSIVAILLRDGEITPEQAQTHPAKGQLSRYVGMEGDTYADVQTITLVDNDRLLLCTDGLTGMVSDGQITGILQANPDPQAACQGLVDAANQAGGKDNITVVIISVQPASDQPVTPS